jgi:hypothetical protein
MVGLQWRAFRVLSVSVSCTVAATPAAAADRHVPSQYSTIQAAVNAAVDGDVIRIAPGTYNERVSLESGKHVAFRGEVGKAAQTVIASGLDGAVLIIDGVTNPALLGVSDLTLTHSGVPGVSRAGLFYSGPLGSPIVIERCIFRNNYSTTDWAGGAYIMGRAEFRRCAFVDNRTAFHGSVGYAYDNCPVTYFECSFRDQLSGSGLFYARNGATNFVSNCQFRNVGTLCSATTGTSTFANSTGCGVANIGGGGFVNGGGNIWNSCPDCDGDGIPNLEEIIFGASDCNDNGLPDSCEIAQGSPDINGNGVLDQCECPSDINASGSVDGGDLAILLSAWGPVKPGHVADIVSDGIVNGADLAIMLGEWGVCD